MPRTVSEVNQPYAWLRLAALGCLLPCLASCGENEPPPSHEEVTTLSPEASKWLAVAEDENEDVQDRVEAVFRLRKLKEDATVDRLAKLLPADYEGLADEIVIALEELGNPKALPALEKLYHTKKYDLDGRLYADLEHAIRACGGNPVPLDDPE